MEDILSLSLPCVCVCVCVKERESIIFSVLKKKKTKSSVLLSKKIDPCRELEKRAEVS